MTGSSSKLLQIQGKMVPGKKTKKNPKPEAKKNPKTILHPFNQFEAILCVCSLVCACSIPL
jgi:hypothetical protein